MTVSTLLISLTQSRSSRSPGRRRTTPGCCGEGKRELAPTITETSNGTPHNKQFGWRAAQRHRAHQLGHNATGTRDVLVTRPNDHWTAYSPLAARTKVVQETWGVKALVKKYLDLWMVGQPYFVSRSLAS